MRRMCFVIAMLGPLACGSEYTPNAKSTSTSNETGGATSNTASGGVPDSGGASSTTAVPIQGGTDAANTTTIPGVAGTTQVAGAGGSPSGGAGGSPSGGTANGGTSANTLTAPAAGAAAGPVVVNCGLPAVSTGQSAKPSGAPGNLRVINWAGYRGAVSYTMDDCMVSQINRYAELQALGVRFTFFMWTNKSEAGNAVWAQALKDGHELGNHTANHTQLAQDANVEGASQFIQERYGVRAWSLAAPYGDMSYADYARGKFLLNRGVWEGLVLPNSTTSPFNFPCTIPEEGALATTMNALVDTAQTAGGWRIILIHGFTNVADGAYRPVEFNEFASTVIHAKSLGDVWIDTMMNIGSYWVGQKLLTQVVPTAVGTDIVYNWSLPDPFPPGKCVRVTVTGGTVKQGDRVLEWDSHGYYEIPLDPGTLTISP